MNTRLWRPFARQSLISDHHGLAGLAGQFSPAKFSVPKFPTAASEAFNRSNQSWTH